jgi:hypothetical protein
MMVWPSGHWASMNTMIHRPTYGLSALMVAINGDVDNECMRSV